MPQGHRPLIYTVYITQASILSLFSSRNGYTLHRLGDIWHGEVDTKCQPNGCMDGMSGPKNCKSYDFQSFKPDRCFNFDVIQNCVGLASGCICPNFQRPLGPKKFWRCKSGKGLVSRNAEIWGSVRSDFAKD